MRETIDSTVHTAFLDPKHTAVLIIDMQNGFVHADSNMGKAWGTERQRSIIPSIGKLVEVARAQNLPIFWSKQIYLKHDVTRIQRRRLTGHHTRQRFVPCLEGTWEVDIVDELKPLIDKDDHVINKHRASFFQETQLPAILRYYDIDTCLVSGVNTEFCIETSVRDGYMRDFNMVVVEDCVNSSRPGFHRDTLDKIQAYFGEVISINGLVDLFIDSTQPST